MFPDNYPYTNFHELNLGYFIIHFREIFSQWADLYDQMLNWKNATDEELATWKAGVEADLDQREATLRAELEAWKTQTGQDIAGWEDATLAALTAWQTATQAVFEAIRVEAAGSASAAAASAGDAATAKTAAETAQAAAEAAAASVQASAAQITTNTADIADLKTQVTKVQDALKVNANITWELGNIDYVGAESSSSVRARTVGFIGLNETVSVLAGGVYGYRFYDANGNFTESPYFPGNKRFTSETTKPADIAQNVNTAKCRIVFRSEPEGTINVQLAETLMSVGAITNPFPRIEDLEEDVSEIKEEFSPYFPETWETGKYSNYDGQVANASNYSLARINVENLNGESITIHSWLNSYAGCPIMTKDGTLLMRTSNSKLDEATEVTFNVTLPVGAAYVYLTTLNGHIDEAYVKYDGERNYPLAATEKMVLNLSDVVSGSTTNPLLKIDNYPMFIDCFLKVGCIGDSLASGESYYNDNGEGSSGLVDIYQHSWGQYLARMTGNTYYNFSKGGLSTKTWLASQYATECFDGNHNCTAYIIGLGQNDYNASYTIGTSADIDLTDYNNNADTFYGSYGKIIQKIQELVPKAKIFVVTDPLDSVDNAGYNAAIRAMATIFSNVYIVDIRQYGRDMYYSGLIKQSNRNGHYNAIAYRLMASIIGTYISWIIEHNPLEFKAIEFIDTQYSVT